MMKLQCNEVLFRSVITFFVDEPVCKVGMKETRLVIPGELWKQILDLLHEGHQGNHKEGFYTKV